MKIYGFSPIADEKATVLILGTVPGKESLRKKEYYANPQNSFWKIIGKLFELEGTATYKERTEILTKNKIALWDVIKSCERKGSLDRKIKDDTPNDFESFYSSHPCIRYVFFNGKKEETAYEKILQPMPSEIKYSRLPSTSSANARMSFKDKLREWSSAIKRKTL